MKESGEEKGLETIEVKGRRAGPPQGKPVSVVLADGTHAELKAAAEAIKKLLAEDPDFEGLRDIGDDLDLGKEEIVLKVDERRAALAGLTVMQVAAAVKGAIDGSEASSIKRGTDEIDPLSYHHVNKVARLIERWTGNDERPLRVELGIFTDGSGRGDADRLSQRRAESVKRYLTQNFDIVPDRLVAVGRGEAEPIHENSTPQGREKNRRAEFVNLGR